MRIWALLVLYCAFSASAMAAITPSLSDDPNPAAKRYAQTWLPNKLEGFTARIADPWDTLPSLIFTTPRTLVGKVGMVISLWQAKLRESHPSLPQTLQFDIDFLIYNHMRKRLAGGFSLDTTDTKFGFHLDLLSPKQKGRIGLKHISAHLVDGILTSVAIRENTYRRKTSYSREFLELFYAYEFKHFKPYIGFNYVIPFHIRPKGLYGHSYVMFQGGGEFSIPLTRAIHPFFAFDYQMRKELGYETSQSYVAGLQLRGQHRQPFRIGLHYYNGFDPRGEFYTEHVKHWSLGVQHSF